MSNHRHECPNRGKLVHNSNIAPNDRKTLEEACDWVYNIGKGNNTILDMFGELRCHKVVMFFFERSERHLTYLFFVLEDIGPTLLCPAAWPGAS